VKVVGVGAGPGLLTQEAISVLQGADLVYGSDRAIELARPYIRDGCLVHQIEDYRSLRDLPGSAVVLSTGDPMLSGLGYLGGQIVPGISSLQLACARLGVSLLRTVPITFHGRRMEPESVADELRRGRCVFLLTDESTDMAGLCRYLEEGGLSRKIAVLTDLGYPQERIQQGFTCTPLAVPGLSCVMIGDW